MSIKETIDKKIEKLYSDNVELLTKIGELLEPELTNIVDLFYSELMEIPQMASILKNAIVEKNLKESQKKWIHDFFKPHNRKDVNMLTERQKKIGKLHANININLNYFTYGISIMKSEIFSRIYKAELSRDELFQVFSVVDQLFDILVSIISEAYFSNEMVHETNELSLKMKGMSQNTAIECERLRSLLLDWVRNSLTFLYQTSQIDINTIPKLKESSFGLWVIYKADLLSHTMDISSELKNHIRQIDESFLTAAKYRIENNQTEFFEKIQNLNEAVSKASWYISTIVDQVIEMDSGMDSLTRLFNRRYIDTILRRQTEISMKQGLPYSILMLDIDHFKLVNDTYGHDSGDAVLKQFSELLLLSVRTSDFIFRYGGEEFLIVLGSAEKKEALVVAEKIRRKCEEHTFKLPGNKNLYKTCSIGVASYSGHPDYNRLIKEADLALYAAKEKGRNRVISES
ncbi:MAG: GGDEF domain-containing protein [Desulfamplus sp.]|nr:GGDEF domain-containing protein [Desulfamplus sp.]